MAFPCLPPSQGHWAGRMVPCPLRPRFLGMEGLVAGLGPALGLGLEPSPASGHGRPQGEAMRGWGGGGGGGGGRASACPTANGRRAEGCGSQ